MFVGKRNIRRLIACALLGSSILTVPLGASLAASNGAQKDLLNRAQALFRPIPQKPPSLPGNLSTPQKVTLGRMLFFDPRLSASHVISCNSCHNIGLGGTDAEPTSVGHRWQHGLRNAPTVFNAVFDKAQFWDGRAKDLEQQAGGPIVNPVEMASPAAHVAEELRAIPGYQSYFAAAFPGERSPITFANVRKAIAVFEATLITPNAPFDLFLRGHRNALTKDQREGLALFMDKGCSGCHSGINIGGEMYAPFGLVTKPNARLLPPGDKGRYAITKLASDQYAFKVPSLRNVELTAPYFHSGQIWDLNEAVTVMGTTQLGVKLNAAEVGKIVSFLGSLTGDQPRIVYPILPPSVGFTPQPQP